MLSAWPRCCTNTCVTDKPVAGNLVHGPSSSRATQERKPVRSPPTQCFTATQWASSRTTWEPFASADSQASPIPLSKLWEEMEVSVVMSCRRLWCGTRVPRRGTRWGPKEAQVYTVALSYLFWYLKGQWISGVSY